MISVFEILNFGYFSQKRNQKQYGPTDGPTEGRTDMYTLM